MLGLCCQFMVPKKNSNVYYNVSEEKNLQLNQFINNKYSKERILDTWKNNISGFLKILKHAVNDRIYSVRMSSNILPMWDKLDYLHENKEIDNLFKTVGLFAKEHNIRITCHPDIWCVLNSDSQSVIDNSINQLKYHAFMFDKMSLSQTNYNLINVHGGKRNNLTQLIKTINTLPDNIKNRLTLENDERSFSVKQLHEVHKETGVSLVFDIHHHSFNQDSLSVQQAVELCQSTWKEKPLFHLSNTEPGNESGSFSDRRKHSQFIHYIDPYFLSLVKEDKIDCDIEAKQKNLAISDLRKKFDICC